MLKLKEDGYVYVSDRGIEYELLKTAYKSLYSILDKIAFFINRYFKLNKELKSVSFNTIWYDKKSIDKNVEAIKYLVQQSKFLLNLI